MMGSVFRQISNDLQLLQRTLLRFVRGGGESATICKRLGTARRASGSICKRFASAASLLGGVAPDRRHGFSRYGSTRLIGHCFLPVIAAALVF
jgi:hypothetical protein